MIAGSNQWPVVEGEIAMDSQESSTLDWGSEGEPFVASPAAFVIEDGIVTAAKDGKEADKLVFEVMGFDAQSKK